MSSSSSTHTRSRVQQCSPQPQISLIGFEPFSPSSGASNASGGRPQATQRSLLSEELCNRGGALKQISSASSLVAIDTSSMIDIESASSDSDVDDRMSSETVINPSTNPIEIRTNRYLGRVFPSSFSQRCLSWWVRFLGGKS